MPTSDRQHEIANKLQLALSSHDHAQSALLLDEMHAADIAMIFTDLDTTEQQRLLDALGDAQAAALLGELGKEEQLTALDLLSTSRAAAILGQMPSDEAADLLGDLPTEEADALMQLLEPELADDIISLLRYSDDTAGGLMAKEFVRVSPDDTVGEVMTLLRRHHDDAEMIYYLYIMDEEDRLLGVVTLRKLIISDPQATMADIMAREFHSVPLDAPQDEVAEMVRRHDLLAIPVLDGEGRMHGMVTVDDIGDVVREEAEDELLEMSGSDEDEDTQRRWWAWRGWRSSLLALAGGLLVSGLIWFFAQHLRDWRDVAAFLPLLLLLGITSGSQSAISMDRSYDNAIERQQIGRVFLREFTTGALIALIGGFLAGILTYLAFGHHLGISLAIALAMILGLWVSSFFGAMGAFIIRRRQEWLNTTAHVTLIIAAVLATVVTYLLISRVLLSLLPDQTL